MWSPTSCSAQSISGSDRAQGTLTEFNPLTGRRLDEIPIDGTPDALAYSEGSIWVLDSLQSEVIRVDPVEKHVVERIVLPGNPKDIAAGDGGIWVLDALAGTATQIDPVNDAAGSSIRLGPAPSAIAVGLGFAWVSDGEDGNLYRIDPELRLRDADPAWYAVGGRRHRPGRSVRLGGRPAPTSNSRVRRHGLADAGTTGHDHCTSLPRSRQSILSSAKLPWLFKFARAWTE